MACFDPGGKFETVVSHVRLKSAGNGAGAKRVREVIYLVAWSAEDGKVGLKNLNEHFVPVGREAYVDRDFFARFFEPVPLITLNWYLPAKSMLRDALSRGRLYAVQNNLLKAEYEFAKVLALDPCNLRALYLLCTVYLKSGNTAKALVIFRDLMQCEFESMAATDRNLFDFLGMHLRRAGFLAESLKLYTRAYKKYGCERLLFDAARVLYSMGRLRAAARLLKRILARAPHFFEARMLLNYLDRMKDPRAGATRPGMEYAAGRFE
jgi:tetratricopeptide (TPR) repeat protein